MTPHPERVPPWGHMVGDAAGRRWSFVSSDLVAVLEVAQAFHGSCLEEVEHTHELVTWPMYRTFIGEAVPDQAAFWRSLWWLFKQEQQLENMRRLREEGWEIGGGVDDAS